ncbi:hypothetical protein V5F32_23575 [Xanthobacter oligotrophicus]|uniref:T2SS protein K first SAM-like domain-containing protein n=1 Tax=Xanthobacter oligotrophicus TaxID=2607286 RepID=A0ABW7A528_9HYPH
MNKRAPDQRDGFILVAVLWILAALASFVAIFSSYVSASATTAAVRNEGAIASGLANAAVELAAHRLLAGPKDKRPTHGDISFRMRSAQVSALFRDEAARIDLNAAPREVLAGLFTALGAQPEAAGTYADRLLAFRAQLPENGGREEDLYREAGLNHGPRGAPFVHVEELWCVAGLPPALVAAALPHVTVYGGRGGVNAAEADVVVRAALRENESEADQSRTGRQATSNTVATAGDTVRVTVRIDFQSGHRRMAEAVILLREFGDDPFRVLDWREEALPAEPARYRGRNP